MKKLTLSLAVAFLSLTAFAQQAEIDATQQAFNSQNYETAVQNADQALKLLKNNRTIEPETLVELYHNAAFAAEKLGDSNKAAKYYILLFRIETKPYFEAKNKDTKQREYFYYKSQAEKITKEGNYSSLKSKKLNPKYSEKLAPELQKRAAESLTTGNDAFNKKDFKTAAISFANAYNLSKALGVENDLYAYYGALAGLQTDDQTLIKQATKTLQDLVDGHFTGVQENYIAKSKVTGEDVRFATKKDMDTQVKLGVAENPRVEKTPSLEEELYSNLTYAYYQLKDFDKGIKAAQTGLQKFPKNQNMNNMISAMYYESGDTNKFISDLQSKVNNNTANATDYYNLAKMMDDAQGDKAKVKEYYLKAIEIDPSLSNAYLNLSLLIIEPEAAYVKLMNSNLGSSAKERKIYNENAAKRKKLYQEALPYLEKAYALDDKNPSIIKVLQNTYDVLGEDDKFMEMKKKLESL
uniref:tetratricopeptide repeat protein n=1 Tax=Ornithobacterium rhinotracheale TaxID=28251 RepID=UPI0039A5B215